MSTRYAPCMSAALTARRSFAIPSARTVLRLQERQPEQLLLAGTASSRDDAPRGCITPAHEGSRCASSSMTTSVRWAACTWRGAAAGHGRLKGPSGCRGRQAHRVRRRAHHRRSGYQTDGGFAAVQRPRPNPLEAELCPPFALLPWRGARDAATPGLRQAVLSRVCPLRVTGGRQSVKVNRCTSSFSRPHGPCMPRRRPS